MIELNEKNRKDYSRKSSKGNQLKFEVNGIWYKADLNGYEGLSEYVVSSLLKKSKLKEDEYVTYKTEEVKYQDNIYRACSSKNFLKDEESVITLARMYKEVTGEELHDRLKEINDVEERFKFICNFVKENTNLKDFDKYLAKLLILDAIFLNEDRHMHNIAVIKKDDGTYGYCPYFDFGASLLSDTNVDYPLKRKVDYCIREAKSKSIGPSFKKQYEIGMKVLKNSKIINFKIEDVIEILKKDTVYSSEEKDRVKAILNYQIDEYL